MKCAQRVRKTLPGGKRVGWMRKCSRTPKPGFLFCWQHGAKILRTVLTEARS